MSRNIPSAEIDELKRDLCKIDHGFTLHQRYSYGSSGWTGYIDLKEEEAILIKLKFGHYISMKTNQE